MVAIVAEKLIKITTAKELREIVLDGKDPSLYDYTTITNMNSLFGDCRGLKTIPWLDTSNVVDMEHMFSNCESLESIPLLDTSNVKNARFMFIGCKKLKTIPLLDTSNVTDMLGMFKWCLELKTIPQLDVARVERANIMFQWCIELTSIPKLNFKSLRKAERMFFGCKSLKVKVSDYVIAKKEVIKYACLGDYETYIEELTTKELINIIKYQDKGNDFIFKAMNKSGIKNTKKEKESLIPLLKKVFENE